MLFSREIAFAAAEVYARAAEQRGAWDARLEALIVDSVLRGEADEAVRSRATALGWESTSGVCVVLGFTPEGDSADAVDSIKRSARARHFDALCAVQGDRLVVVLGGVDDADKAAGSIAAHFGDGAIVTGPIVDDLLAATGSARAAVAGLRAAQALARSATARHQRRPPARAVPQRRRARPPPARLAGLSAAARGRVRAAGDADGLPRHQRLDRGHRASTVRTPQHRAVPAQTDHRSHRTVPERCPRCVHLARRSHPWPPAAFVGIPQRHPRHFRLRLIRSSER